MSHNTEPESRIDRRTFVKGIGATGTLAVGMGSTRGPVGEAQALPPLAIGVASSGAAAAVGWAVREGYEALTGDEPTDGLGPDALHNQVFQMTTRTKSENESTFIDNKNIISGIGNIAYTDGKIAAIEELNNESSLEVVQDAADEAAREHFVTVQENLLKTWNESVREFRGIYNSLDQSEELDVDDVITMEDQSTRNFTGWETVEGSQMVETANGEFEVETHTPVWDTSGWSTVDYPRAPGYSTTSREIIVKHPSDGDNFSGYLDVEGFGEIFEEIEDELDSVTGGLQNWTANVYSEVQSGSIDVADLLTPREQAELLSDDEEYPQAVADLIALNIPVDPDREATISFDDRDITISGLMAPTSPPEDGFQTGNSYDPAAEDGDLYFTYDPALGSGGWAEVEPTISQGELVFTDEPYADTLYQVPTNQGTVEVVTDDFDEDEDGGTWVADVSDQVERTAEEWTDFETGIDGGTVTFGSLPDDPTDFEIVTNQGDAAEVTASSFEEANGSYEVDTDLGIAEIAEVTAEIDRAYVDEDEPASVYAEDGETGYETVQINDPFTIEAIENSDGEEVGETEYTRTEPQNDENYITQEEWDDLEDQNQELIERYEDAMDDDGVLGGWDPFDGGIPEVPGGAAAAAGVAVVLVLFGAVRQIASLYIPGK
ncbi:hypothetical protein J2751_000829 [Halorubrum alkaliphilum]|uniref:Envelope protein N-terminal domain-containing protein n=1 Tax=Halorubrum alkaliphilum TaxID=261290 RepID=A0A8T4GF55_9EURY|nr:hypothetical protein [Halorubrum alkaliphilum]MBP1921832.1 hypothetical protein [Halorubrum alkaliphilum]